MTVPTQLFAVRLNHLQLPHKANLLQNQVEDRFIGCTGVLEPEGEESAGYYIYIA